jgi:hypothetical protein
MTGVIEKVGYSLRLAALRSALRSAARQHPLSPRLLSRDGGGQVRRQQQALLQLLLHPLCHPC